jgi:2-hydroxy-3-oxopropionate reductase
VVDFSTIRPDVARDLAARAAERGLRMLDAPVSGGQAGAENAALSIMVGGEEADVAAARPLLDVVGSTVVHVGPSGAGQTVKAANQLIVAGNIALLAEAIEFLRAHGADLDAAVRVLGGGLAGSKVLDQKAPKMLSGDYSPGFRIDLHHKDMGIVADSAREAGVVAPVAALVAQLVAATRAAGDGGLDHSALHRTVRRLNGESS